MKKSNIEFLNLKELIGKSPEVFRIPDYQRGYSWEERHFQALWDDLINLRKGRLQYHYTGMLIVERINLAQEQKYREWKDYDYIEDSDGYFVVDGQQRLTSISILLFEIIRAYFEEREDRRLLNKPKKTWMRQYIFRAPISDSGAYVFGYETDNPSDNYFKKVILEDINEEFTGLGNKGLQETAYTKNLYAAKIFFRERVQEYLGAKAEQDYQALEELTELLTEKFVFDFKILNEVSDIFMVFETMNTRGKKLSNLENLKNRLIYLSTLIVQMKHKGREYYNKNKNRLRQQIVEGWKDIYTQLGQDKRLMDTDDRFLQNHWIMYDRYDRSVKEFYAKDIFDEQFTVERIVNNTEVDNEEYIKYYVESLTDTAKWWFIINAPGLPIVKEYESNTTIIKWLIRINRLGFRFFAPLLLAGLQDESASEEQREEFLQLIEHYIFLLFSVSGRRSNTGSYHFRARASHLYKGDWTLEGIINDLRHWIYGTEEYYGYFSFENFYQDLEPLFENKEKEGYKNWSGLRYLLAEYTNSKNIFTAYNSYGKIIPIYEDSRRKKEGFRNFNYTKKQRHNLQNSLGNFILLKTVPNNYAELSFQEIKDHIKTENPTCDVLNYAEWTPEIIYKRGEKILTFLEKNWQVKTNEDFNIKRLLYLDFLQ